MAKSVQVAVIGGGLVGGLEACLLAQRGYKVTLFESRQDGRNEPNYYGRSINLAISHRGVSALKRINMDHLVKELGVPMKARMIHDVKGYMKAIQYDPNGRYINSIERAALNNHLLNEAERRNVKLVFSHKLVDMNAEKCELVFRLRQSDGSYSENIVVYKFDLILGCDGARSSVRSLLSRVSQNDVSQTFIEHGYLELRIDANTDGTYKMPHNYLHIWPRGAYMMIALPNKDASFTCTLFMPFDILNSLNDDCRSLEFFKNNFADAVELIGAERIVETLTTTKPSPLISVKCSPYFYKDKIALLGDAAHAMVPFYGQGMNCGFEDCLVLDEILEHYENVGVVNIGAALEEYSRKRCPNGHSMCDLAMYNYVEMRDLVNTWSFMFRKKLDNFIYYLAPNRWIPLYTMVTFSRIPIDECTRRRAHQDKIVRRVTCLMAASVSGGLIAVGLAVLSKFRVTSSIYNK